MKPNFNFAKAPHPDKPESEDALLKNPPRDAEEGFHVYLLADGMGGMQQGSRVSQLACDLLATKLYSKTEVSKSDLEKTIQEVQEELVKKAEEEKIEWGCTLVAVLINFKKGRIIYSHLGDSRLYLMRSGELTRKTKDHSLVQELIDSGKLLEMERNNYSNKEVLTQALGVSDLAITPEAHEEEIRPGDLWFMCSDGIWERVKESRMKQIIDELKGENKLDQVCQRFLALTQEIGQKDDATICSIEIV